MFRWLDGLAALLFPPAPPCPRCGGAFSPETDGPVCRRCGEQVAFLRPPLCIACCRPLEQPVRGARCSRCSGSAVPYRAARALAVYDGLLRDLIHRIKFGGDWRAAEPLSTWLGALAARVFPRPDIVLPVPGSPRGVRARGFDHAVLLAGGAARRLGVPCEPGLLGRVRETEHQSRLSASERRRNLVGAFAVHRPGAVAERRVLVVDDMLTTGATACEVARVLRDAGAREVWILVAGVGLPRTPAPAGLKAGGTPADREDGSPGQASRKGAQ